MKICENCGNEHVGKIGSGRFCSLKCARGFSTKSKRKEINEKVSATLTGTKQEMTEAKWKAINLIAKTNGPKISKSLKKYFEETPKAKENLANYAKNRIFTKEIREKISKASSERAKNGELFLRSIKCNFEFNDQNINCDSKLELKVLKKIVQNFSVKEITRSSIVLEYTMDNSAHRFNPDFKIILNDDSILIVECKTVISKIIQIGQIDSIIEIQLNRKS